MTEQNNPKDALIAQLKKQSVKNDKEYVHKDDQFNGHNRVYFFKRLEDDYIFPIDNERAASHLIRRREFGREYQYIGWSDGRYIAEFMKTGKITIKMNQEAKVSDEAQEKYQQAKVDMEAVLEKELEAAIDNPDKMPPRDFRKMNLNGQLMDSQVAGWMDMFRR